jgi:hypothetical protein
LESNSRPAGKRKRGKPANGPRHSRVRQRTLQPDRRIEVLESVSGEDSLEMLDTSSRVALPRPHQQLVHSHEQPQRRRSTPAADVVICISDSDSDLENSPNDVSDFLSFNEGSTNSEPRQEAGVEAETVVEDARAPLRYALHILFIS